MVMHVILFAHTYISHIDITFVLDDVAGDGDRVAVGLSTTLARLLQLNADLLRE
jgi:hypothetical protein